MIHLEKQRFITGKDTVSALSHTACQNKEMWESYDWSTLGEEWTNEVHQRRGLDPIAWKRTITEELIHKYFDKGSTLLEIGPGGGRWTSILLETSKRLILADISEKCLRVCRDRFKVHSNIDYLLIKECSFPNIEPNSIDGIWSYDVFVHINPTEIEAYLASMRRVLKPGGCAIIHHAGTYADDAKARNQSFRSYMDGPFFGHLVAKYDMELIEQNQRLPHYPGDVISIFRRPSVESKSCRMS